MFGKLTGGQVREKKFWEWFSINQENYYNMEDDTAGLFSQLKKQLEKVHKNLSFEFSPLLENGKRELVISADGIKKVFPAVQKLVAEAPVFEKWDIIAFRQPHAEINRIELRNVILDFEDVFFRHAIDKDKIAIELNIRNYKPTGEFDMAVFIMLDSIVGEYDTEMMLGFIDRKLLDEKMIDELDPITDLPLVLAKHKEKLFG